MGGQDVPNSTVYIIECQINPPDTKIEQLLSVVDSFKVYIPFLRTSRQFPLSYTWRKVNVRKCSQSMLEAQDLESGAFWRRVNCCQNVSLFFTSFEESDMNYLAVITCC